MGGVTFGAWIYLYIIYIYMAFSFCLQFEYLYSQVLGRISLGVLFLISVDVYVRLLELPVSIPGGQTRNRRLLKSAMRKNKTARTETLQIFL